MEALSDESKAKRIKSSIAIAIFEKSSLEYYWEIENSCYELGLLTLQEGMHYVKTTRIEIKGKTT